MMSTDRVFVAVAAIPLVGGIVYGAVTLVQWAITGDRPVWATSEFGVTVLTCVLALAAVVLLIVGIVAALRRLDPIWAHGGTITVDDHGVLTVYTKKLFREPESEAVVQLDDVAMLTWYIDMFDPAGVECLQFWDQDPELTMDIFGLMPQNRDARTLVEIPQLFLKSAPTAEARLRFELARRIDQGALLSNVDVQTWEPIGSKLPPLADGIRFEGRKVIREARREDEE